MKYLSVRVTDETGEELFAARTDDASPANGHITVTWKADGTVSLTVTPDEPEQIDRPTDDDGRVFLCRSTDPADSTWADKEQVVRLADGMWSDGTWSDKAYTEPDAT